jgi:phenylalanyl-tRNA synthetase beta chain
MKLSLNWLRDYVEWDWTLDQLIEKLTMSGTEVEAVHQQGVNIDKVVTAKVLSKKQHPNADRLSVCEVNDGKHTRQIVCGAQNFKEGDIVPLALPGAVMPGGFTIKDSKLRGEKSEGMMCAADELGLEEKSEGLLLLPADTALGQPIANLFPGDTVLELEVTPNRPDLLSYVGLAREFVTLGARIKPAKPILAKKEFNTGSDWKFTIDNQEDCPRFTAQLITGVTIKPSPKWLQDKLLSIGLRPINNVVDITNYILFDLGRPLHSFDADKLQGKSIRVRRAQQGEIFVALDAKEYKLTPDDLVVADAQRAVAMGGVMGGLETGVTESTKNILLEAAMFRPSLIRNTSRKYGLISDSSYRFERGVDPGFTDEGRARAAALICELAGGQLVGAPWQTTSYEPKKTIVNLRPERTRSFLATKVSDQRIAEVLAKLGLDQQGSGWSIPSWRLDLEREVDLIEEVARIEGLANVERGLSFGVSSASDVDKTYDRNQRIRAWLTAQGFYEAITTTILPREAIPVEAQPVTIKNPMNEDYVVLRQTLLSTVLPCVAHNLDHEQRDVRLFELGRVFTQKDGASHEQNHLLILIAGLERAPHWTEPERKADVFTLKGVVETLRQQFPELQVPETFGLVPTGLLKKHGIKIPVYACELILQEGVASKDKKFKQLPQFPSVTRDLAFIVDQKVTQQSIREAIDKIKIPELESITCFDQFIDKDGSKLAKGLGKKSLAYSLTYRSSQRTLNESEVTAWESQIIGSVCKATGAELRGAAGKT